MKDAFADYHPILNFIFFLGVIGVTVFVTHPVFLGISFVSAIAYACLLKGVKQTLKLWVFFCIPVMVVVALMNPLFNHYGVTILGYLYNGNPFTLESMVYGLIMALMLSGTLIWFSCYTEIMTSDKFIYLFGRLLPALSLVLSMCLRFVPRFMKQLTIIGDGQKCVGRSMENGNVLKRVRHGITIFSILVTWSLENAIETADSMKCRGYGEKGRTAFSIYHFDKRDLYCLCYMAFTFGLVITGSVKGYTVARYNPRIVIEGLPLNWNSVFIFLGFLAFCLMPVGLELTDRLAWRLRKKRIKQQQVVTYRLWEVEE